MQDFAMSVETFKVNLTKMTEPSLQRGSEIGPMQWMKLRVSSNRVAQVLLLQMGQIYED